MSKPADLTVTRLDAGSRLWTLASACLALLPLLLQLPTGLAFGIGAAAALTIALSWRKPLPALLRMLLAMAVLVAGFSQMGRRFGRDTGCALPAATIAATR